MDSAPPESIRHRGTGRSHGKPDNHLAPSLEVKEEMPKVEFEKVETTRALALAQSEKWEVMKARNEIMDVLRDVKEEVKLVKEDLEEIKEENQLSATYRRELQEELERGRTLRAQVDADRDNLKWRIMNQVTSLPFRDANWAMQEIKSSQEFLLSALTEHNDRLKDVEKDQLSPETHKMSREEIKELRGDSPSGDSMGEFAERLMTHCESRFVARDDRDYRRMLSRFDRGGSTKLRWIIEKSYG
ncbi:hypothetical protein I302_101630 [Kwoniella bestiolae CBS 10118]